MNETESENDDNRPSLETDRLLLRPFVSSDAAELQVLINDREIASNTRNIEFPYPDGAALKWIEKQPRLWKQGKSAIFAICLKSNGKLTGAIGLEISEQDQNAELGYWLGRDYWGQGICTDAAAKVVEFGLDTLALNKIHAHHLCRNPASGRVLEKVGMKCEGVFRSHVRKWGVFEDVAFYGILRKS